MVIQQKLILVQNQSPKSSVIWFVFLFLNSTCSNMYQYSPLCYVMFDAVQFLARKLTQCGQWFTPGHICL